MGTYHWTPSAVSGLDREAKLAHGAGFAVGFSRVADAAAVPDEAVVRLRPAILRQVLHEGEFGFQDVGFAAQSYAVGDAEYVCIDGDALFAESDGQHDIRRLAPDARERHQPLPVLRHLAVELIE
jgi:hypothetical protein